MGVCVEFYFNWLWRCYCAKMIVLRVVYTMSIRDCLFDSQQESDCFSFSELRKKNLSDSHISIWSKRRVMMNRNRWFKELAALRRFFKNGVGYTLGFVISIFFATCRCIPFSSYCVLFSFLLFCVQWDSRLVLQKWVAVATTNDHHSVDWQSFYYSSQAFLPWRYGTCSGWLGLSALRKEGVVVTCRGTVHRNNYDEAEFEVHMCNVGEGYPANLIIATAGLSRDVNQRRLLLTGDRDQSNVLASDHVRQIECPHYWWHCPSSVEGQVMWVISNKM